MNDCKAQQRYTHNTLTTSEIIIEEIKVTCEKIKGVKVKEINARKRRICVVSILNIKKYE